MRDSTDDSKDQSMWKWARGAAFDQAELGNPADITTYRLCIYDSTSGAATLSAHLTVDPDANWLNRSLKGWDYEDKTGVEDGVLKVLLRTGDSGRTRAFIRAKGASVPMPTPISGSRSFAQDPRVTVQVFNDATPTCWSSQFTRAVLSDGVRFKAKVP